MAGKVTQKFNEERTANLAAAIKTTANSIQAEIENEIAAGLFAKVESNDIIGESESKTPILESITIIKETFTTITEQLTRLTTMVDKFCADMGVATNINIKNAEQARDVLKSEAKKATEGRQ